MKEKFTMLVAEDNETDLALLENAVSTVGENVNLQVTHDGDEAISYLRGDGQYADRARHPLPDLLVLDLKMPRVNGLGVLRWLRTRSECAHIPKIVLSGSSVEKDVKEAYYLGANTFFTKPSSLSELRELMQLIVGYWSRSQRPVLHHSC